MRDPKRDVKLTGSCATVECPDDNALNDFIAGALQSDEAAELEGHLADCTTCRAILVDIARTVDPDGPSSAKAGPFNIGLLGKRYVPEEVLGVGGMSIVYRGRDRVLDRPVALKFMLDAPDDVRTRLRREARALAMLSHPNIVDIYDLDISEGSTFIACELVPGGSLTAWMNDAPRTASAIINVIADAAKGLEAAHQVGLVHRDVSPNNILVGADGRGHVADFGLARLPDGPESVSGVVSSRVVSSRESGDKSHASQQATGVVGTPAYIAPEVLAGNGALAAADQYSLSVVAFEALHGVLPAQGAAARPGSGRVARVLARGMRKRPSQRYPSMLAFRRALETASRPRSRLGWAALGATALLASAIVAVREPQGECGDSVPGVGSTLVVDVSGLEPRVADTVTEFTAAWADVRARTCDGAVSHAVPAAAVDRRWACLHARESDLLTTTQIMASQPAGPATLTTQFRALEALAPPSRCEDDRRLELSVPPPPVAIAVKVDELSTIGRRVRAGSYWFADGVADELNAAIEVSSLLDYGPLTARLLMYRGQFERDRNELAQARETLESAALLATASKDDTVAALCWVTIISMEGYANQNFDEAIALLPLADARITRMENPADLVGMRERTLALVYDTAAKYDEAERHHLEALKWTEQAYGGVTVSYAEVLANMGAHYSRRRMPKLAQLRTEEALEITRRRLGPGSLNEALLLRNLAVNATVQSQSGRAAELANASLTTIGEFLSPNDSRMAPFLTAAGEANLVIGQSQLAIEQLTRALELSEASLPATHPLLVDTRRIVGEAYTQLGRLQDADDVLMRAMVDLETHRPHVRAQLLYDVGALRLAQGRHDDAAESCERARREAVDVPAEDLVDEATRCRDDARKLGVR